MIGIVAIPSSLLAIVIFIFLSPTLVGMSRKTTSYDTVTAVLFICALIASAAVKVTMVLDLRKLAVNITAMLIWGAFFIIDVVRTSTPGELNEIGMGIPDFAGFFVFAGWPYIDVGDGIYIFLSRGKIAVDSGQVPAG